MDQHGSKVEEAEKFNGSFPHRIWVEKDIYGLM
jgi:hypothetical protein